MTDLAQRWQGAQLEYGPKIRTAAYNSAYVSAEHDVEDMEQELLVVLWEACRKYDPSRGATFNSFFWMMAKQKIGMLGDRSKALKRTAELVSLDAALLAEELDAVDTGLHRRPAPSAEDEALLRMEAQGMARRARLGRAWRQVIERYATA